MWTKVHLKNSQRHVWHVVPVGNPRLVNHKVFGIQVFAELLKHLPSCLLRGGGSAIHLVIFTIFKTGTVKVLFFEKRQGIYSLWNYEFTDANNYNSIKLSNSAQYEIKV
jgi:hypothetical protein